jgi:Tfp pilus assembly protein PilF
VPFALLLGLAAAGVALCGWRGSGGWLVWSTALACLAVPLIFYVGSRYRLPLSTVLCVPAGAGLVSLFVGSSSTGLRRRGVGWVILLAGVLISFFVPSEEMFAKREAVGLVQRAWAWGQVGDPAAAEADLRRALETDGDSVPALFNLARLFERTGRVGEAETTYRRALEVFPGSADAAGNLGRLLHRSGRADQAVPILRRALEYSPVHRGCWTNLVVALTLLGDPEAAWGAAEQALDRGVELDPGLLGGIRQLREEREEKEKR